MADDKPLISPDDSEDEGDVPPPLPDETGAQPPAAAAAVQPVEEVQPAARKSPGADGRAGAGGESAAAGAGAGARAEEPSKTPPRDDVNVDRSSVGDPTPRSLGAASERGRPVEEMTEAELREELRSEREAHARTRDELSLFEDGAAQLNNELAAAKAELSSSQDRERSQSERSRGSGAASPGTLQTDLDEARKRQEELEQYSRELDGVVDRLQASLDEETAKAGKTADERVVEAEARVEEMRRTVDAVKADHLRMERELAAAGKMIGEGGGPRARQADGEGDLRDGVPYDVLDQLDGELAEVKSQLKQTQAELDQARTLLAAAQRAATESSEWKESAVQAQEQLRETSAGLVAKSKEAELERRMRREIEARFEEKLHLKVREGQNLNSEVERLKKAGDQLEPLLAEIEHLKAESRHKLDHRAREIQRLQIALQESEKGRQISDGNLQVMKGELQQWEGKVKNAEEVRWMAGMNLAKAKAEMDWRQKADQEKDFFLERMKDELERLKAPPHLSLNPETKTWTLNHEP
ncbi:hypothetical protein T484DRAFT_2653451 [Baffinella frigidus]|nr:hypothetical protein T484DRAFT_2653451 [Cryptophyta sp. CCMP2293]